MAQVSCNHSRYGQKTCPSCHGQKNACTQCANPFNSNKPLGVVCSNCGGNINKKVLVSV